MSLQAKIEKSVPLLIIFSIIVISFGGLVQIVPLFFMKSMTQPIEGLKPYTAMELTGRDLYIRDGCNTCHSQMIRPFRAETERYGHYSLASEFIYDRPFLWGSKRTGPDLHRVGGRYSDEWHRIHLINPRDVVPESVMPGFPWLAENTVEGSNIAEKMKTLRTLGVPYSDEDIAGAADKLKGKSEMDAMIAYLQNLGSTIPAVR
jgi:cytochrome c oxidase cbb3-type subunit 2